MDIGNIKLFLKKNIAKIINVDEYIIENNISIFDFGIDEVLLSSLISIINDKVNIDLTKEILFEYNTIDDLSLYIFNEINKTSESSLSSTLINKRNICSIICKIILEEFIEARIIIENKISTNNTISMYNSWLEETFRNLQREKLISIDNENICVTSRNNLNELWNEWDNNKKQWLKDFNLKGQVILVEKMLRNLIDILTGKVKATDIMFKNSSSNLVQAIYEESEVIKIFNNAVAKKVSEILSSAKESNKKIRIMEIGAGTGATTNAIFNNISKELLDCIYEYCFTDISEAFLLDAKNKFSSYDFMEYKLLNIEKSFEDQNFEKYTYDIVLATNVLHATKNIRKTIRNTKGLLKKNGKLIINELSENSLLTHLTFGLLEGWWLFEDKSVRMEGGPLVSPEIWNKILRSEGYLDISFPEKDNHKYGEQIIVASSNGIVRLLPRIIDRKQVKDEGANNVQDNHKYEDLYLKAESYLKEVISSMIGLSTDRIDSKETLNVYGMDSLMIIKLTKELKKNFSDITTSVFFECQTVEELSTYLINNEKDNLVKLFNINDTDFNNNNNDDCHKSINEESKEINNIDECEIAIIGIDGAYAGCSNVRELWSNLSKGKNMITEIPFERWDNNKYLVSRKDFSNGIYTKWGGFIKDPYEFDPLFFKITPSEAIDMDPQERLFLEKCYGALEDAGYTKEGISKIGKVGVFAGVMNSDYINGASYWSIANRVSYTFNFNGPSISVDTACSSSLTALHIAIESIQNNDCQCALVGGVNLILSPNHLKKLCSMNMLSEGNKCNAFGNNADGFVDAEGVGVLVLKPLKMAIEHKDNIYAVIKGTSINSGGKTNGYTVPNLKAQAHLIEETINKSNINPEDISYIEAHGTGTSLGDPIETKALTNSFSKFTDKKNYCTIGSIKSNIGHTEGAAGIAAITKVLLQMRKSKIVPSINCNEINENINLSKSPFKIETKLTDWNNKRKIAGISSFGAGGANSHIILEEYKYNTKFTNNKDVLVLLSARSENLLKQKVADLLDFIHNEELTDNDIENIAYTLQVGREVFSYKLAFTATSINEINNKLKKYLSNDKLDNNIFISSNDNKLKNKEIKDQDAIVELWNNHEYSKIGELWSNGVEINWLPLYKNKDVRKISLPTTPFNKKKYKKDTVQEGNSFKNIFLQKNISNFYSQKFENCFTGQEKFIKDHVVNNNPVIPAAAFIEMAIEAINSSLDNILNSNKGIIIKNISIDKMCTMDKSKKINIVLNKNEHINFEIIDENKEIIATGIGDICENCEVFNEINEEYNNVVYKDEFYDIFKDTSLCYGDYYKNLRKAQYNKNSILLDIEGIHEDKCLINPGILDTAIQGTAFLVANNVHENAMYLPYSFSNVRVFDSIRNKCNVKIDMVKHTSNEIIFSMKVFDNNKVIMSIDELSLVKISSENNSINSSLMFRHKWTEITEEKKCSINYSKIYTILLNFDNKYNIPNIYEINYKKDIKNYKKYILDLFEKIKNIANSSISDNILIQVIANDIEYTYYFEGIYSLLNTINIEYPSIHCQIIINHDSNITSVEDIIEENSKCLYSFIKYENGIKYTKTNELIDNNGKEKYEIIDNGVYVVLGGISGIGYSIAKKIVTEANNTSIYITGKRELSENIKEKLEKLSVNNSEVYYESLDVTNSENSKKFFESIYNNKGKINGIFYLSGITKDNLIVNKSIEEVNEVLAPKIDGIINIDEGSKDIKLDFLVLFSSIAGEYGNVGQSDYSAANGFLMDFALYRNKLVNKKERYGNTVVINWPLWEKGSMNIESETMEYMKNEIGIHEMPEEIGINLLQKAIVRKESCITILYGNEDKLLNFNDNQFVIHNMNIVSDTKEISTITNKRLENYLLDIFCKITALENDEVNIYETFENYGIDSIKVMKMTKELENIFGKLPKSLFYKCKNIFELKQYLIDNYSFIINKEFDKVENNENNQLLVPKEQKNINANNIICNNDIAIIGISGQYPDADNIDEFWNNLKSGKDSVKEVPKDRWNYNKSNTYDKDGNDIVYCRKGGFINNVYDFDPLFFNISPKEAEMMNPQERLFLETVYRTMDDAGYVKDYGLNNKRTLSGDVGVYVGVMYEDYQLIGAEQTLMNNPMALSGISSSIANRISYFFNFTGPSMAISTMCSSSLVAINLACESILNGNCNAAIAGGVNVTIHPNKFLTLSQGNFASKKGRCASFGEEADGYVPGEGVGAVLLKPLNKAIEDGDNIYGVIKASATNHGGKSNGFTVPNPDAQVKVIEKVIEKSGVNRKNINYFEAHGTGTSLGDPIEIESLEEVFKNVSLDKGSIKIGSVKSNIGHLESAAGMASLTKVLLQMKYKTLVPSLHCSTLNKNIDFDNSIFSVSRELTTWNSINNNKLLAGISAFGAGGTNAHIIVEEYIDKREVNKSLEKYLILLSGKDEEALIRNSKNLLQYIKDKEFTNDELINISYTLLLGREDFSHRLAFTIKDIEELKLKLHDFINGICNTSIITGIVNEEKYETEESYNNFLKDMNYEKVINLWIKGYKLDFNIIFKNHNKKIISLPSYSFDNEYYKINEVHNNIIEPLGNNNIRKNIILDKKYKEYNLCINNNVTLDNGIIILDKSQKDLEKVICENYKNCYVIYEDNNEWNIDICKYNNLIDLTGLSNGNEYSLNFIDILQKFIDRNSEESINLICATRSLKDFKNNKINLRGALKSDLYKCLSEEYSKVSSYTVDFDNNVSIQYILDIIVNIVNGDNLPCEMCVRDGKIYKGVLEENHLNSSKNIHIASDDVLVVTGGTRGIGFITAKHFAQKYNIKNIALIGKEKIAPKSEWSNMVHSESMKKKINNFLSLEKMGVNLKTYSIDFKDPNSVSSVFKDIRHYFGKIDIVIHAAGSVDIETPAFVRKTIKSIENTLEPKVMGINNILNEIENDNVKFTILYSSISAELPKLSSGQLDYVMANSYMNYVALKNREKNIISIEWPSWKEVGFGEVKNNKYSNLGLESITNKEGLEFLDEIIEKEAFGVVMPLVVNNKFNINNLITTSTNKKNIKKNDNNKLNVIQEIIINIFSEELKIKKEKLDINKDFQYYGVDSVLLVQIVKRLNKVVKEEINPSILLEHTSILKLSLWIENKYGHLFKEDTNNKDVNDSVINKRDKTFENRTIKCNIHNNTKDIAIVGISCTFPGANNKEEYFDLLSHGKSAIKKIPYSRLGKNNVVYGGIIDKMKDFDYKMFSISKEDADLLEPQSKMLLNESVNTFKDAGYNIKDLQGKEIGVFIGGRSQNNIPTDKLNSAKNPIIIVGQNYLAANISNFFDFKGKSMVIDTACSSALVAIDLAIDSILKGDIEGALVGGVNYLSANGMLELFDKRGLLSKNSDFHIFDKRSSGILLGEGVGMVYIKTLDKAIKDNDNIYAVIKGVGTNNDGRTMGPATPNLELQKKVIEKGLRNSNKTINDIEYIECNGSGTEITDLLELKAMDDTYGISSSKKIIGCAKPNIGHTLCAEGISALIKVALMIKNKKIVPFISAQEPMNHYDFNNSNFNFVRETIEWNSTNPTAAINCFADGGTNVHLVLESYNTFEKKNENITEDNKQESTNRYKRKKMNAWKKMSLES